MIAQREPPTFAGCVVTIDRRGVACLSIEDHTAEYHDYAVRHAPEGFDAFAVDLVRLDGSGSSPHRVAVSCRGKWSCSCESFRYRRGPHAPAGCIHSQSVKYLYLLLRSLLTGKESP